MITEQQAIEHLYMMTSKLPYKQTSSWTCTREFKQSYKRIEHTPFVLDERFVTLAEPDSKHTQSNT